MKFDPDKHHRRSIRLKGYDYSRPGAYYVTICVHNRECLFGNITNGEMHLNEYGKIVQTEWLKSSEIRNEIELDAYQIMPNHFHGIVIIQDVMINRNRGDRPIAPAWPIATTSSSIDPVIFKMKPKSLSSLMAGFQSPVTSKINQLRGTPKQHVWQRNYFDRIIRNDNELNRIRKYIIENPMKWDLDKENPNN
jgi:REP element-mobilizing transposase RayT